jgi:E3 ubiquitin-protein ligase BOI-like protein
MPRRACVHQGFRFTVFPEADGAAAGALPDALQQLALGGAFGGGFGGGAHAPPPPLQDAAAAAAAATAAAAAGSVAWHPDDREAPPTQCSVCWNAHVRVLLLPCSHLCMCAACDAGLVRRVCPLCRESITATINVRYP